MLPDEVLKCMARLWQFDMPLESVDENRLDMD
ncbi:Stage V sporulation protein R (plasmid) [Mycetohabitans rhizoxinica HKI 454]|uniref:Stage V sporulation protein R n=1 Tax=Mycetohabitans rhizoxinica (strain DSM 19002 / CIP 109453 / HKI 454) TaxID=882378 RepID=E5AWA4_MYCRK|nr:Stage V sporulation protein R [Mycetohabitans rhizoxinica HKI 454]